MIMSSYMRGFLIIIFGVVSMSLFTQNSLANIRKDQKMYELSVIWKELSYNFANMDNCPGLNLDSLYRAYLPIVQRTRNDFEYYKSVQQFLAHFNNGHVRCDLPRYILHQLSYPLLITSCKNSKIIIENIGSHYSGKVKPGDEIESIDNIPAMEYIKRYSISYVSASNDDGAKMENAMFNSRTGNLISLAPKKDKKKIILEVKTLSGREKVCIPYDMDVVPSYGDSVKQATRKYIKQPTTSLQPVNELFTDSLNSFVYLHFTDCDKKFGAFFDEHYDSIRKYKNLIIDISDNGGGDGNVLAVPVFCLVDKDSLQWSRYKTRINNASFRAKASSRLYYYKPEDVKQQDKDLYYPYFYDTAFEDVPFDVFANPVPASERYKGNIFVITGSMTGSAAEFLAVALVQNPRTTILGQKTAGANGQPLVVKLPSGLEVFINTSKSYDYKGRDISSGVIPDYEADFTGFYAKENHNDMLIRFENYILRLK